MFMKYEKKVSDKILRIFEKKIIRKWKGANDGHVCKLIKTYRILKFR